MNQADSDAPVWGAEAIGAVIGKPERATFHMLENGSCRPGSLADAGSPHGRSCSLPLPATRRDRHSQMLVVGKENAGPRWHAKPANRHSIWHK
jgi:hypothetical protein